MGTRHVCSLWAGMSAQQTCCILSSRGRPSGHSCNASVPQCSHDAAARAFSGGAHTCSQNKASPWPSEYLVTCTHSAPSDLGGYITVYLQNVGPEREATGRESLSTAILVNLLSPDNSQPHPSGGHRTQEQEPTYCQGRRSPEAIAALSPRTAGCLLLPRLPVAAPQPRFWEFLFIFPAGALHSCL